MELNDLIVCLIDQDISSMTSSSISFFFLVLIPNALYTPSIYIKFKLRSIYRYKELL
jgi:hypothetical protein